MIPVFSPRRIPRCVLVAVIALALFLGLGKMRAEETPPVVRCVAFSADGKTLAVSTGDPKDPGTVSLWDVSRRKRLWLHNEKAGVPTITFSPDGKSLALAGYGGVARLLDVATGTVTLTLDHPKEVRGVSFSPDGKLLATACWDKHLRVWDLATGTEKLRCVGHRDRIFVVEFSPDGKHLLSVACDDGASLWDSATGERVHTMKHYHMPAGRFSPDGRWIITGSSDGTTRLWNRKTGAEWLRFSGTGGVRQLAVSQSADKMAVAGYGREVDLFDLNLNEPTAKNRERIQSLLSLLDDDSYEVREASGKQLLAMGFLVENDLRRASREAKSAEVRIRTRRLRKQMLGKPLASFRGHTDNVLGVAFSPDGKLLATGGRDGTVRLWDVSTQKELACIRHGG